MTLSSTSKSTPSFGTGARMTPAPTNGAPGTPAPLPLAPTLGTDQASIQAGVRAPQDEAQRLEALANLVKAKTAEQASAIEAAAAQATDGNVVAQGFNTLVNMAKGNRDALDSSVARSLRVLRSELPKDLETFHDMMEGANGDPVKLQAASEFLQAALMKAQDAGRGVDEQIQAFNSTNKFWSGLTADVSAGLLTLGGAALVMTGLGAPIGVAMIAGAMVVGGAATVGAHALLDNQYSLKEEGAGNFLLGGLNAGAAVFTGGMSAGLTQTVARSAALQGAIGGMTGLAQEGSQGFQEGWLSRLAVSIGVGATVGGIAQGAGSRLLGEGLESAIAVKGAQAALGSASGAAGSGGAALLNEAGEGFQEGWQNRVTDQAMGGALAGAVSSLGPNLAARNVDAKGRQMLRRGAQAMDAADRAAIASVATPYGKGPATSAGEPLPSPGARRASNVAIDHPAQPGQKLILPQAEFMGFTLTKDGEMGLRLIDQGVRVGNKLTVKASPELMESFGLARPEQLGKTVAGVTVTDRDGAPVTLKVATITGIAADGQSVTLADPAGNSYARVPASALDGPPALRPVTRQQLADQNSLLKQLQARGAGSLRQMYDYLAADLSTRLAKNPSLPAAFREAGMPIDTWKDAPAAWERLSADQRLKVAQRLGQAVSEEVAGTFKFAAPDVAFESTDHLAGSYKDGRITLNPLELKGPLVNVLDTLVHEQTHAYQGFLAREGHQLDLPMTMREEVGQYQRAFQSENYVNPAPDLLKPGPYSPIGAERMVTRHSQEALFLKLMKSDLSSRERLLVQEWRFKWTGKPLTGSDYLRLNRDLHETWMKTYKNQALEGHADRVSHSVTSSLLGAERRIELETSIRR